MTSTQMTPQQRRLVEENIGLARHIAWDACRRSPSLDSEDALSVAYEALVSVAARFDPEQADVQDDGTRDVAGAFAGYARRRIAGAILDWQRGRDHVPRRLRTLYKTFQRHGLGAGMSMHEVAERTGLSVDKVRHIVAAVESSPVSLHSGEDEETGAPLWEAEHAATSEELEASALTARIQQTVISAYDDLSPLQQVIIAMRYYEGMDLTTVAAEVGASLTTVRVAHSEALLRLHEAMVMEASF